MASVSVNEISKTFHRRLVSSPPSNTVQPKKTEDKGTVHALCNVTFRIPDGSFFFLLGPSGCGKSTLLRILAGLEQPDSGSILFDDQEVTFVPTHRRQIGMVFQNYALWPHLDVYQNLDLGLRSKGLPGHERRNRIGRMLELVQLNGLERQFPSELSGGQQQRVALARALVLEPRVLLLDEPMSNLDPRLKTEILSKIRELHRILKTTFVYVTHDQEEALSLATQVAIMNSGKIAQIGEPEDVYTSPRTPFVARFFGDANVIEGRIHDGSEQVLLHSTDFKVPFNKHNFAKGPKQPSRFSIRPESIQVHLSPGSSGIPGHVKETFLRAGSSELLIECTPFLTLRALLPGSHRSLEGQQVTLTIPESAVHPLYDDE
jgi:ABC-type Fe3+/spermidine/putrescine transport system ATPase subunit